MVRFVVDDKAHANSKIRSVLADDPAALALWTVAGSWCGDQTNDGFVPDHQLPWLMPVGGEELARKLVRHGLWRRVRGGYQFHEWSADGDGTRRNLTRQEVLANRQKRAEAGRKGGLASGKTRSKDEANASADAPARAGALLGSNTSTNTKESSTNSLASEEPDGFADFWGVYPFKRGGRAAAVKAYRGAARRATPAAILSGVKAYRDHCARERTEERFVAHAATWLNQSRWDEFAEKAAAPAQRAKFAWEN